MAFFGDSLNDGQMHYLFIGNGKAINPFYTTKGVRLDVYLKEVDKIMDVELQC